MNDIKLLASGLDVGDSLRTTCPRCHGGSSGEKSFVIRKDDEGVVYCCFRANCGYKGGYRGKPGNFIRIKSGETDTESNKKYAMYKEEYRAAKFIEGEPEIAKAFWEQYHFDPVLLFTRVTSRSYLFPCYDHNGFRTGHVEKFFSLEPGRPKVLTRKHRPDVTMLGFWPPLCRANGPLIIVEDIISAGAVSNEGLHAVALLGTNTTDEGWSQISNYAHRWCKGEAFLALDYDATAVAIDLAREKKHLFNTLGVTALVMSGDIKDMLPEQRTDLLSPLMRREPSE